MSDDPNARLSPDTGTSATAPPPLPSSPPPAGSAGSIPSGPPPATVAAPIAPVRNGARRLDPDSTMGKVLALVDRVAEVGRSKTTPVRRAASVARKLPAILFGVTLAAVGATFLLLGALRGLVEVTGAVFGDQKPWVAWMAAGGILFVSGVFIGTVRNREAGNP